MLVKYSNLMRKLHNIAGEIGTLGETDERYATVYAKLSDALDAAEYEGLIAYSEDEDYLDDAKTYLANPRKLKPIVKALTKLKRNVRKTKRG